MPNTPIPNPFNAPIPGSSLTKPPKGSAWQKPPKYTNLTDACNYVFDRLTQEPKLHVLMAFIKKGVPLEAIARVTIMSGFQQGLWTPDLGMLMSRPVIYMLAGIAKRAKLDAKLTSTDRSGLKDLVGLKSIKMTDSTTNAMQPQPQSNMQSSTPQAARGLLSKPAGSQ